MVEILTQNDIVVILPFVLITLNQVHAIIARDGHKCLFPDPHKCKGKLTVHHIIDKADVPENLITVCSAGAHWGLIHNNGTSEEDKDRWATQLALTASSRTQEAKKRGWKFE